MKIDLNLELISAELCQIPSEVDGLLYLLEAIDNLKLECRTVVADVIGWYIHVIIENDQDFSSLRD